MLRILRKGILICAAMHLFSFSLVSQSATTDEVECDRDCLESYVDRYLDAVIDNDPSQLSLSDDIRFTEDGQRLAIGDGLWRTMKNKGEYRLFVSDIAASQVAFIGTIAEDHSDPTMDTPALIALRLRIDDAEITEIEQLIIRSVGAAERVAAAGQPHEIYTRIVPEDQRMSREDLIITANKYFTGMQENDGKGDYPFGSECIRFENGMQTTSAPTPAGQTRPDPLESTSYSSQWNCLEQFESGLLHFVNRIRDRRYVAVDEERGIVFSFAFFDHSGGETRTFDTPDGRTVTAGPVQPWTWQLAELFKVENFLLQKIEAILARSPYGMNSGWSTWEQGMSDEIQDVTMSDD
jgi:hypothetical protein